MALLAHYHRSRPLQVIASVPDPVDPDATASTQLWTVLGVLGVIQSFTGAASALARVRSPSYTAANAPIPTAGAAAIMTAIFIASGIPLGTAPDRLLGAAITVLIVGGMLMVGTGLLAFKASRLHEVRQMIVASGCCAAGTQPLASLAHAGRHGGGGPGYGSGRGSGCGCRLCRV